MLAVSISGQNTVRVRFVLSNVNHQKCCCFFSPSNISVFSIDHSRAGYPRGTCWMANIRWDMFIREGNLKTPCCLIPFYITFFPAKLPEYITISWPPTTACEHLPCKIKHERWMDLMVLLKYLQCLLSFGHIHLPCHYFRRGLFRQDIGRFGRRVVFV